jgi:hypothetical protein
MKAKFGAIIVAGSGKIGGHVASKNRGGAYLRTKVTPTNPQSIAQGAVRARMTSLSQGWRGLSASQRAGWNGAVGDFQKTNVFGDITKPSGINLYTKLNANLMEAGAAQIVVPPLPDSVGSPETLSAVFDATLLTMVLTFTPSPIPAGTAWIVRATEQVSPGISNLSGKYRNIEVLPAATMTGADIVASYVARFGGLVAGRKIGIELVAVNTVTGQKGASVRFTGIVTA